MEGRRTLECYYWGKKGNFKSECKAYARDKANGVVEGRNPHYEVVLQAGMKTPLTPNAWCIDSGASRHMSGQQELFQDLRQFPVEKVYVADGRALLVAKAGKIVCLCYFQGRDTRMKAQDVLLVEDFKGTFSPWLSSRPRGQEYASIPPMREGSPHPAACCSGSEGP